MTRPAILSVGRFYCDLIFSGVPRMPTPGTEVYASGFSIHAGGGAFITGAHLSSLGHPVALAAMLPGPPFSGAVRPELEAAGLNTSLCRPLPAGSDPQVTVALACQNDRAFLSRRSGPAFPPITPTELAQHGIRHLHIGELASLVEQPEILVAARAARLSISLDCSWDETLTAADIGTAISAVDVFLPNAQEIAWLKSLGVAKPFAPLTIVKEGASGATAHTQGETLTQPTQPIDATDTTGAGDAFNAGFLSAWLTGRPLQACLAAGNAQGRLAISARGGFHRTAAAAAAEEAAKTG